jgi:hypothetical protein
MRLSQLPPVESVVLRLEERGGQRVWWLLRGLELKVWQLLKVPVLKVWRLLRGLELKVWRLLRGLVEPRVPGAGELGCRLFQVPLVLGWEKRRDFL